jgi:hypothetical protein
MFALVSATRPGIAEPLWAFTASNPATLTASYHACIAALPYPLGAFAIRTEGFMIAGLLPPWSLPPRTIRFATVKHSAQRNFSQQSALHHRFDLAADTEAQHGNPNHHGPQRRYTA